MWSHSILRMPCTVIADDLQALHVYDNYSYRACQLNELSGHLHQWNTVALSDPMPILFACTIHRSGRELIKFEMKFVWNHHQEWILDQCNSSCKEQSKPASLHTLKGRGHQPKCRLPWERRKNETAQSSAEGEPVEVELAAIVDDQHTRPTILTEEVRQTSLTSSQNAPSSILLSALNIAQLGIDLSQLGTPGKPRILACIWLVAFLGAFHEAFFFLNLFLAFNTKTTSASKNCFGIPWHVFV